MRASSRHRLLTAGAVGLSVAAITWLPSLTASAAPASHQRPTTKPAKSHRPKPHPPKSAQTATPIKHVVVIYDENVSFDHYFATYPDATNPPGEPPFVAAPNTPSVNGLMASPANGEQDLLHNNPNGADPQRLDPLNPSDVLTCDQDHDYTPEQEAFDHGKMDDFPDAVGTGTGTSATGQPCDANVDLDYYDGNTVTALWEYAQHFALNDNSYGTTFGPSSPGAINVVSGDTDGVGFVNSQSGTSNSAVESDGIGGKVLIGDTDPYYDDCSSTTSNASMTGENIGDQLNAKGLSWGWFQGGFAPTTPFTGTQTPGDYNPADVTGRAVCGASHNIGAAIGGTGTSGAHPYGVESDYIQHHEPFQYYASTANPHHLAPTSLSVVGTDTQSYTSSGLPEWNTANHQYDTSVFNALLSAIDERKLSPSHFPAVTYLKAPGYEDGHAGFSDPLDEQVWLTTEINAIEKSPDWSSTAIILSWDDSDGWYDHVWSGAQNHDQPQNASHTPADALTGAGACGTAAPGFNGAQGRCGYGPRLPLLVISPYAKTNFVDNTLTNQASIVKFIEYNWHLGNIPGSAATTSNNLLNMFDFNSPHRAPALFLSTKTGEPVRASSVHFLSDTTNIPLTPQAASPKSASSDLQLFGAIAGLAVLAAGLVLWRSRRSVRES